MIRQLVFIFVFFSIGIVCYGQSANSDIVNKGEITKRIVSKKFESVPQNVRNFHAVGTIRVFVTVDRTGRVTKSAVLSGFNHVQFLRDYIELEVSSWKFKPLKIKREPVAYRGVVSIPFYYGTFPKKMPR